MVILGLNYTNEMKYYLYILIFNIYLFGGYVPSWYHHLPNKENLFIGYGNGKSELEAKANARSDIASSISVSVDDTFSKQIKSKKGKFTKNINQNSLQKSKLTISDTKVVRIESHNGIYFVALQYENISSIDKFIKKLPNISKSQTQNEYIKHTIINKKIKKILGKNINFSLARINENWFIKYKNITQILNKKDFEYFFKTIKNNDISIKLNKSKNTLFDKDKFYFKIKSKKDGFVSLLSVYEDGTVSILMKNIEIKKHIIQDLPDKEFEQIPTANLLTENTSTYDLHIAIFSKNELALDEFAYADAKVIKEEKHKNFDDLIQYLNNKTFSSIKVFTKPKIAD